tara:strand:- start:40 stop:300 length:261 start_codon:yes stop_codon:yes gene_type:complete
MNLNKQNLINKILYRAKYRGTKEMDIFVSSFVNSIIYSLSIDELGDLDKIVNLNDEMIIELGNYNSINHNYNKKIVQKLANFQKNK